MAPSIDQAYPGIAFNPRTRGLWSWLSRRPAECIHLQSVPEWAATLVPDTAYLRGKARHARRPMRPEVSVCRACLLEWLRPALAKDDGLVIAFEPDPEAFSQYFFVAQPDFDAAGVMPAVAEALEFRLENLKSSCEVCHFPATWLCLDREQVSSLDDWGSIRSAAGHPRCAPHGADWLCKMFEGIPEANLFYLNLPYGGEGAYLWF
jgi:hypothetical protein